MDFMMDKRLGGPGGYIDFNALASAGLSPAAIMNLLSNMPGMNIPGLLGSMSGVHPSSANSMSGGNGVGGNGERERVSSSGTCALPKGWSREETKRQTGLSAGRIDVYYVSPEGKKFWTKPQLARYFGDSLDLTNFDFHSGKFHNGSSNNNPNNSQQQPHHSTGSSGAGGSSGSRHSLSILPHSVPPTPYSQSVGSGANLAPKKVPKPQPPPATITSSAVEISKIVKNDTSLQSPIRQTASIFKQPVTIIKTQKSRVKTDFKHGVQESPKQLFWEKRLEGLRPCGPSGTEYSPRDLPKRIASVGPRIDPETVYHSISTALHLNNQPIIGQLGSKSLESNPGVYVNPDQPLIKEVSINEEDIQAQEEMVFTARKQLELALQTFYPTMARNVTPTLTASSPAPVIPPNQTTTIEKSSNKPGRPISSGTSSNPSTSNPHKKLRTGTSSHHNLYASIKS